jgi:hypothetical protein
VVPKLKNLRLSGILVTLEVCTQRAITEKLSQVHLVEDVARRAQRELHLRLLRPLMSERRWRVSISDLTTRSSGIRTVGAPMALTNSGSLPIRILILGDRGLKLVSVEGRRTSPKYEYTLPTLRTDHHIELVVHRTALRSF